jgi:hypothetical protein
VHHGPREDGHRPTPPTEAKGRGSSPDIGHIDVPDMTEVAREAHELVEHGLLTGEDSRDFMFTNAVRSRGEVNPDFFKGTAVEKPAAEVLAPARP